jgi:hypothetical protein
MFSPRAIGGRPRAARIGDLAGITMFANRSCPLREADYPPGRDNGAVID